MKTNYPLRLERHDNPFFTLSDVSSFSQGFAYYHGEDYPILMHSHDFYELNVGIIPTTRATPQRRATCL